LVALWISVGSLLDVSDQPAIPYRPSAAEVSGLFVELKNTARKYCYYIQNWYRQEGGEMRSFSLNGTLLMFMERGEKLTHDAIWNDRLGPDNRYVLWPRGEFWDVRFKYVKNNKLEWLPVGGKPFADENAAWQAAYGH